MSSGEHPVGYRPPPGAEPTRPRSQPAGSGRDRQRRGGCSFRTLFLLQIVVIVGAFFLLAVRPDLAEKLVLAVESQLRPFLEGIENPDHRAGAEAFDPEAVSDAGADVPSATLDSGQVIEGDFRILSFDEVRAEGGIEAALDVAIEKYPDRLRELLDEGVDPNQRISHQGGGGYTHPVEKAVRQGSRETLEILLEAGADINGQSSDGDTGLHAAVLYGDLDTVRFLLSRGADPNVMSVGLHDEEVARRVEDLGQSWEPHVGSTVLERAASRGHIDVVRFLLDHGAQLRLALLAAASCGSLEMVDLILDRGVDPLRRDSYDGGALRHLDREAPLEVAERLLEVGARPGEQALRQAAQWGRSDLIRAYADAGVRFDGPPTYWGPLYAAAHAGQAGTVELLLELGASTGAFEDEGRPIDIAREQGHTEVVALLEGR